MKLIKFKLIIVAALVLLACLFPALHIDEWMGGEPEPETPVTALADQLDTGYLIKQDLATQQKVFWRYYNYNSFHGIGGEGFQYLLRDHELRFLPEFAAGAVPDWEQTSRYLCDFAWSNRNDDGALRWAFDDMVAVRDVLLPTAEVERGSSGWLNYIADKDCYDAVGWDANGTVYYLLTEPVTEDDGVYTAKFAGYALGEMWFDEEESGGNYNDRVAFELWQHGGDELSYFIDEILPGELAAENLTRCENLTVTFRLSGDEELPLSYLSCEREELLSN